MIDRVPMHYTTHGLHNLLKKLERSMPPPSYQRLLDQIAVKWHTTQRSMAEQHPGKNRAKLAHKAVQEAVDHDLADHLAKPNAEKPSCRAGCSGCCHMQTEITGDEAALYAEMIEHGLKVDMVKLEHQATTTYDDITWWRQSTKDKACLFLGEDGKCRIYANRPLACRKYYVFTPAEKCSEVSQTGSIEVGVIALPNAEIVTSAIMDLQKSTIMNMPKNIWKHLKRKAASHAHV